MGLFEKIFGGKKDVGQSVSQNEFKTLTAYSPVFTSSAGAAYENELVRAAIHARANHISKLKIEFVGRGTAKLKHLEMAPNEFQTWSQFLYRLSTILDNDNTAFIVPHRNIDGHVTGLYPVIPRKAKIIEKNGNAWLTFEFREGKYATERLSNVGVMTKFQYLRDFFGEGNSALDNTMKLIDIQSQGIAEGVKSAATYRFMAQVNNFTTDSDLAKERMRFDNEHLNSGGGGLLLFPNRYSNIQQINAKPFVVDAEQMRIINQNVYNYFGVNDEILQNKAVGDSWSAFYEGAVEPFAVQLSEVLTKMMIECGEIRESGNVMATANRLQYMTNADKLNVSAQMADRGIMNRDEIREIWNLPPLPNGEGKRYTIRGEYYFTDEKQEQEVKNDADQE